MQELIYKCDVCGKTKAEVNHWYLVSLGAQCLGKDVTLLGQSGEHLIVIFRWENGLARDSRVKHVCGQEHAIVLASRWMHSGGFEKALES